MRSIYKIEILRGFESIGFKVSLVLGCGITLLQWITSVVPIALQQELYMNSDFAMCYPANVYNNWIGANTYLFSYLYFLLIPLLAALPHGSSFYSDIHHYFIQNICIRVEKKHYYIAKYLSVFFTGGITVVLPLIFNYMLTSALLPMIRPQAADYTSLIGIGSTFGDFFFKHPMQYVCVFAIIIFIAGGIYATYALIGTYYTENVFIVLSIPFVFVAFLNSIASLFGAPDWQSVFFLNPGYNGDRVLPIIVQTVGLAAISLYVFVVKGSKEDIC